jgi:hypothetical protein
LPLTHSDRTSDEKVRDNVLALYEAEKRRCEPDSVGASVVEHYEQTLRAINRMRIALRREEFSFS